MQFGYRLRMPKKRGAMIGAISLTLLAAMTAFVVSSPVTAHASPRPPVPAVTSSIPGVANNYADGGSVTVAAGTLASVSVGPLFPASLGCTAQPGSATSSGATLNLQNAGGAGAVTDHVQVAADTSSVTVTSSSTVANVNLLNGEITASAVNATAQSHATATMLSSKDLSTFTNVVVGGRAITIKPNLKITLPGIGYVVLDERSSATTLTSTRYFVNAIDAHITTATLGLPVGAEIIVGYAMSQFTRTDINAVVGASSSALYATGLVGRLASQSGPYAMEVISCVGSQGTVSLTNATIGGALTLGVMTDTAHGQISLSGDMGAASSTIANVELGTPGTQLLSVGGVQSTARASFDMNGHGQTSGSVTLTNGSILSGLLPGLLPVNPAPNTRISIPSLGYVVLNQQTGYVRSNKVIISVTAIVIVVTVPLNMLGLPVGARISIGVANANATNPNI